MKLQDLTFKKQVDCVLNNPKTDQSNELLIIRKNTPRVLQKIGVPNLPIFITRKHIITTSQRSGLYVGANYHGLGKSTLYRLPELLESPIIVAESLTRSDSIVIIADCKDSRRDHLLISLKLNGVGNFKQHMIKMNILTSVYGKKNLFNFIKRILENNALLLYDKEKSQHLPVTSGLQLPSGIANFDFYIIVKKFSIIVNKGITKK